MKKANNDNANGSIVKIRQSENEFADYKQISTYLKTGETVVIDNVPNCLETAIETFGGENRLIDAAVNYVIAHSLLAKARKIVADGKNKIGDNIYLTFEPPSERGQGKPQTIKLSKLKGDDKDIETFKAMAEKLGLKFA